MNVRHGRLVNVVLAVTAIAVLGACSGRQTATPAAPSSTPAAVTPANAGSATIAGTLVGTSSTSGWSTRGAAMTVSVTGTPVAATVDGGGRFMLQNVPAGRVDLHFTGNGTDAHLILDGVVSNQVLTITVRVSGSAASLENDNRGPGDNQGPNNEVELEGPVSALGASSLTVAGRVANVTASTVIVHGGTTVPFSSIHVGDRVHVKGTPVSAAAPSGPINATRIEVQNPDDNDDNDDDEKGEVELKGTIAAGSLGGSCATNSLTFRVGSTPVRSNAGTQFKGTTCAALAAGDPWKSRGAADRLWPASRRRIEKETLTAKSYRRA
jgi:hypothetical protein